MKILRLIIKSPRNEIIRDITFEKTGVSYIYGDIASPSNKKQSINSLGKTLLLKLIDYIFGANEDSKVVKEDIHGYILESTVFHDDKSYNIKRILGNKDEISINGKEKTLSEYKHFFNIQRKYFTKQIVLSKKSTEISENLNPTEEDIINTLYLLKLLDLSKKISEIYILQHDIKNIKTSLQTSIKSLDTEKGSTRNLRSKIQQEIYFNEQEIKNLNEELISFQKQLEKLNLSDFQNDTIECFYQKQNELSQLKSKYEDLNLEKIRLNNFLESSNKIDITSKTILSIFKKAKQETPEMIKKTLYEVEDFYKNVYEDRKNFLKMKIGKITSDLEALNNNIHSLMSEVDELGCIIADNKIYQELLNSYNATNSKLNDCKYEQGRLSHIKVIDDELKIKENNLSLEFIEVQKIRDDHKTTELIEKYAGFISELTNKIYSKEVSSFFNIEVRSYHLTRRPVKFEIQLRGDSGEGIGDVKKNLVDYLVCKYNDEVQFLIQDSSCYNGIDPRQISSMFDQLDTIAKESEKQIIISINKYQLGNYNDAVKKVEEKSVITLSEKNLLFKFKFNQ